MSHGSTFIPRRLVLAEFPNSDALLAGAKVLREKGYAKIDTHTPYPIHGIEEALGLGRPRIPTIVLCGAITGMILAFTMMYYMNVYDWPINVANRPPLSLPAFVPITFELAVLLGGTSSFFGVMVLMGMPKPYHPVFQSQVFCDKASIDGFFVSVEVEDADQGSTLEGQAKELGATHTEQIVEVER